ITNLMRGNVKHGSTATKKNEDKVTVSVGYLRSIEKKVEDLETIIEVSSIISSTLDYNKLISLIMEKAKHIMQAEACSIMRYDKESNKLVSEFAITGQRVTSNIPLKDSVTFNMGQGIAGWVAERLEPAVIKDVYLDERFYRMDSPLNNFKTKSLIAVPLVGRRGLLGVAMVMNSKDKGHFSDYDAGIFQIFCLQISAAIENSQFYAEAVQMERFRQGLEIASVLQKSFLPDTPAFQKGNLHVSAINIPADKVGGDIYDFIEPVTGSMGILVGDVSGKGISAALYMAKIISDFRYKSKTIELPEVVFNRLNTGLSNSPMGMFLTASYFVVDVETGHFTVSTAGHPPFLWITEAGVKVMEIPSGPPLGILQYEYKSSEFTLKTGDRLLVLTDGAFDAKNTDGQRLGFERLAGFVNDNRHKEALVQAVIDYV
ncbi:MAG: SpoIIE family protein phosphatase, partial [Candidatus Magnetominusculus sp. LBB02]|nr:SpoIIE family protein phosphatase [Candidatus Magnetominusculus sp. LBB02]